LIAALILAAGKSERMGRPKALLEYDGSTFLERILNTLTRASVEESIVVLGHHKKEILARVALRRWIENPNYESGMTSSIQAGIQALGPEVEAALLFLVDHPMVAPETVEALIARASAGTVVLPMFQGRRGHPVVFGRAVLDEILALGPDAGANRVVRRDPSRVVEVAVSDPGVLLDVDTPDEFESLRGGS
jgi:molybdenum cofactor cytidylyltransferase